MHTLKCAIACIVTLGGIVSFSLLREITLPTERRSAHEQSCKYNITIRINRLIVKPTESKQYLLHIGTIKCEK